MSMSPNCIERRESGHLVTRVLSGLLTGGA